MSGSEANKRNIKKLVSIRSWASCGVDPALMGTGPIPSSKALDLAGWNIKDVDLLKLTRHCSSKPCCVKNAFYTRRKSEC